MEVIRQLIRYVGQVGAKKMNLVLSVSHFSPFIPNQAVTSWSPRVALQVEVLWFGALEKIVPSSMYILRP